MALDCSQPDEGKPDTRRGFLRRVLGIEPTKPATQTLPPWSRKPAAFDSACTGCGDCITACPEHILQFDTHKRPVVDFALGACTFCGDCADSCHQPAFVDRNSQPPWDLIATISSACLAYRNVYCRSCADACEPGAIRFSLQVGQTATPELAGDACTGCGACVGVCPATAIGIRASNGEKIDG